MKVVLPPPEGEVEGLGAAAGEMPLVTGPLAGAAEAAVRAAGFVPCDAPPDGEPALVLASPSSVGRLALHDAWVAGTEAGEDLRITVGGRTGELLEEVALGGQSGSLWYLHAGGGGPLRQRLEAARPLVLDPCERELALDMPGQFSLPVTQRAVVPIRHWVQLLWANLLGIGWHLPEMLLGTSRVAMLARILWAALRARSLRPEPVMGKLTRLGRGAVVHPRATVEASVLGPGARVGAGAVVRFSVLGAGARVEDLAICEASVLGDEALVQRQAACKFSVVGPRARLAGCVQLGVLGPGASLKRSSYLTDQSLSGEVRVRAGGTLVRPPFGMVGCCLGAGASVLGGVWVAPGRVLPPGVAVTGDQALVHPDPPSGVEGPFVVRGGRLERP